MNRSACLFFAVSCLLPAPLVRAEFEVVRVPVPVVEPLPEPAKPVPAEAEAAAVDEDAEKKKNLPDQNFLNGQRRQRDNAANASSSAVNAGEATMADLLQFRMEDDMLELEAGADNGVRSQRFELKGGEAHVTLTRNTSRATVVGNGVIRPASTSISVTRIDLGVKDDDTIWQSTLSRSSTYLSMSGMSVLGRVSFSQNMSSRNRVGVRPAPPIRFTVYEWQAGPRLRSVFSAQCDSIDDLRSEHPEAFRKHLVPLFRKFSDLAWMIPGATDAYGVFGEVRPEHDAVAKLTALLPDLDSASYAIREAASAQLMQLGPQGVLAALRMDPASLTDEQKGQLGRLIAAHRRREIANPLEARKDPGFLTDCLEYPDPAIRQAALESLEKLLEKDLSFDPALSGDALTAAADEVRKQVRELIPATQPADPDVDAPAPDQVPLPPQVFERRELFR